MESSQSEPEVKIRVTADFGNSDSDECSTEEIQSAKAQGRPAEYDAISEMGCQRQRQNYPSNDPSG